MPEELTEKAQQSAVRCPRCGSTDVRRSKTKGGLERAARLLSPLRPYRCRTCRHRGWHWGSVGGQADVEGAATSRSRPLERRDLQAKSRRRRRLVASVILGIGLGVASGFYLHSCQKRAELVQSGE